MKLEQAWYAAKPWLVLLRPLALVFAAIAACRKQQLLARQQPFPLPIIVVGNITVGGTGKTPVVIAVARYLRQQGHKPAIITRGYGGRSAYYPLPVDADTLPQLAGDEAVLIARRTQCPVVVAPKRLQAALYAVQNYECDVLISDDGLQHYALPRNFEIAVVDGQRGFGNGRLLPEGPLREPPARLRDVHYVLVNGTTQQPDLQEYAAFHLEAGALVQLTTGATVATAQWQANANDRAIAAIGNPQRFAATLAAAGLNLPLQTFADHHLFTPENLPASAERIIMTEKDAVKCSYFDDARLWYLPVTAQLPAALLRKLDDCLAATGG